MAAACFPVPQLPSCCSWGALPGTFPRERDPENLASPSHRRENQVLGLPMLFKQIGVLALSQLLRARAAVGPGRVVAWMPRGHHAAHWPWGFPPNARTSRSVASDFRELLASLSWVPSQGGLLTALSFLSVPLDMVNWASVNKQGNDAKGAAVVERPLAEPLWDTHCVRGARGLGLAPAWGSTRLPDNSGLLPLV